MQLEPKDLYEKLEYDKILELLESYCLGDLGKTAVQKIKPETETVLIEGKLQEVQEFKLAIDNDDHFPIYTYQDLSKDLRMLEVVDFVLPEESLRRINVVLVFVRGIFRFFNATRKEAYPILFRIVQQVSFDESLIKEIARVIDEEGNILPNASGDLLRIRKQMIGKKKELERKFRVLINEYRNKE